MTMSMQNVRAIMLTAVLSTLTITATRAQDAPAQDKKPTGPRGCPSIDFNALPFKSFHLNNVSQPNDGNEILTGMRLMLDPSTKMYLVPSQNLLMIRSCPDELILAQKLLDEMDHPHRKYRLSFTLTEMDGTQRIGTQHVDLAVEDGQRSVLRNGSKVPIVTGSTSPGTTTVNTQATYLDIGTNIDVTPLGSGDQVTLKAKVERSSVAEDKSGIGPQDPIVRQSILEGVSLLTLGKPQMLGTVDITGTTRRLEIEATAELIK